MLDGKKSTSEKIVYVGVSSRHRQNAFDSCNFIIDWLKTNAPFWKSEELENSKDRYYQSSKKIVF